MPTSLQELLDQPLHQPTSEEELNRKTLEDQIHLLQRLLMLQLPQNSRLLPWQLLVRSLHLYRSLYPRHFWNQPSLQAWFQRCRSELQH